MIFEKPIEHLLVDLDGTLLGNRDLSLTVDFITRALGALRKYGGLRKAAKTLLLLKAQLDRPSPDITNDKRVIEVFSKRMNLSLEEGRRLLKELVLLIFPQLEKHFFPVPGAKDFLDWAKDRYPLTLATNPVWPVEVIELRVRWAGLDPAIFGNITHVTRMHACKPTTEYYKEILAQQNLVSDSVLLIGDDVKMDLPATEAGIRVYIVGKHDKITPLKHSKAKAPAWRGSYPLLRQALEAQIHD